MTVTGKVQKFRMREISVEELGARHRTEHQVHQLGEGGVGVDRLTDVDGEVFLDDGLQFDHVETVGAQFVESDIRADPVLALLKEAGKDPQQVKGDIQARRHAEVVVRG